jgi:hypothetical protein
MPRRDPQQRLRGDASKIPLPVAVVVAKGPLGDDARAQRFERPSKSRRVCQRGEQPHLGALQQLGRYARTAAQRTQPHRRAARREAMGPQRDALDERGIRGRQRSVDDADGVGVTQDARGLAQRPARQGAAISAPQPSVEGDKIEVPVQAVVLEAVVENQYVRAEDGNGAPAHESPVAAHQHGHSGRVRGEHHGLVSHHLRATVDAAAIGYDDHRLAAAPAVAAARDRDLATPAAQPRGDPGRQRRLPRPADDEVPDADDVAGEVAAAEHALAVERAVNPGNCGVEPGQRQQREQCRRL